MLTVEDDPIVVMEAYAGRGWGDGLPLVPPTGARVDVMLDALGEDPSSAIRRGCRGDRPNTTRHRGR